MNELWKDIPNNEGVWWAVNPKISHDWIVVAVLYEICGTTAKLRIHLPGNSEHYLLDRFVGELKWQKAITPVYHWYEK